MRLTTDFREILVEEFLKRRKRNSNYSLRAFARDLKLSPAAVSEVFRSKRKLSKRNILKVSERLALSPRQRQILLGGTCSQDSDVAEHSFLQIREDHFQLISNWFYFAILSLAETSDASANPEVIAERLGLQLLDVQEALARLIRLEFIDVRGGILRRTLQPMVTTSHDIPSTAIKNYHAENLKLAERSLYRDPVESRDISSINMAIDPRLIPEAKKMIQSFRRRLSQFLESGEKTEVYTLAVQLFPVSRSTVQNKGEK